MFFHEQTRNLSAKYHGLQTDKISIFIRTGLQILDDIMLNYRIRKKYFLLEKTLI